MLSRSIREQLEHASWIRFMFEEGARLRAERGAENVFDFSLGNPVAGPPAAVIETLRRLVSEEPQRSHAYMQNAGYPRVREAIAQRLAERTGLPYTWEHVLMTVGAAGAINTYLRVVLDPCDEVIVPLPYFSEYQFYISNQGGRMVAVESQPDFQLDLSAIEAAITGRTKVILLNSPNNPSGVIYRAESLRRLGDLLAGLKQPISVLSDEPYREICFGCAPPEMNRYVGPSALAYSWSKSFGLAGERIGYLAISPHMPEGAALARACSHVNRTLGFVNAPALWQWVVCEAGDAAVEIEHYRGNVTVLCDALEQYGYELTRPAGAFYVFPRTPIADDLEFARLLQREGILGVPGRGFGMPGHIRLSLAVERDTVERALPGFRRAIEASRAVT